MSRKFVLAAATAAALCVGLSGTALADQIGISGAAGSILFTSNGNGTLNFNTSGFTGTLTATFQSPTGTAQDVGNVSYGSMSGTTGTEVGGVFSIPSVTESFTYTSVTDSDTLTGTITWVGLKDGTTTPQFDVSSFITITSVSGDSTFTGDFPVGSVAETDLTLLGSTTLTTLASQERGSTASFNFSSGEIVPTPLPAALPLFATGFVALWGLGRKRRTRGRLDSALAT